MLTLVLAGAIVGAMPTYPDLPADLASAARAFDAAQVRGDRVALERLLSEDYVLINSADQEETKANFIRDYTAPGSALHPLRSSVPCIASGQTVRR